MVTYFNRTDLVKFGEYLLSKERTKRITENYEIDDNIPLDERLSQVYHADVENFIEEHQKRTK